MWPLAGTGHAARRARRASGGGGNRRKDTRPEVFVDAAADLAPNTEVHALDPGLPLTI